MINSLSKDKNSKFIYGLSFLLPIGIMMVSYYFNGFYPFGSKSLLAIDFNQQFIDLYVYMKNMVLNGDISSLFYSFSKSIGGNMIGVWSYYLLSPFNLLYVLLPIEHINLAIVLTTVLRYGTIAISMSYYLIKRHQAESHPVLTILVSTVYALCGFSVSYQMVPIFYDALWLLPLVLIGLEELIDGKQPYRYLIFLSVAILLQYYMAYMICLFIIFYSIYYILISQPISTKKQWWLSSFNTLRRIAFYSIFAIGLVAFIFIPNLFNLLDSKGALGSNLNFVWELQINPFDIFSKLMIGAFDNQSWAAGPNLPNIYIASIGLVGVLIYYLNDEICLKKKIASSGVFFVFLISIIHEFTSKIWHMGQNPAGFFYRFSWIISFYALVTAFIGLKNININLNLNNVYIGTSLAFLTGAILLTEEYSFLSENQLKYSIILFVVVLLVLYLVTHQGLRWSVLFIITLFELGVNATIIHSRMNFSDAYKFEDAVQAINNTVDEIRPDSTEFYRIAKTFYRSMNDPMMFNYPGLTHFSSNLEMSTRKLFENLGNIAVDAKTYYYGTPLTDALFSVRYIVDDLPFPIEDKMTMDRTHLFQTDVSRKDLIQSDNFVHQTDRFDIFQIPHSLPIAFAVPDTVVALELESNQPVLNQNRIAQALGLRQDYLHPIQIDNTELDNIQQIDSEDGELIYEKIEPGISKLSLSFIPTSDDSIYITIPRALSTTNNDIIFHFNGDKLAYRNKFSNNQLINLTDRAKGQEQVFEMIIEREDEIDLAELQFVRTDNEQLIQLIQQLNKNGIEIKEWGNNFINGQVYVQDDLGWMFTTIPYDKGWQVKVDDQKTNTVKIWDSLLAFQITPGAHQIQMLYYPPGLGLGLFISLFSFSFLMFKIYQQKKREKLPSDSYL